MTGGEECVGGIYVKIWKYFSYCSLFDLWSYEGNFKNEATPFSCSHGVVGKKDNFNNILALLPQRKS
jgi:hypothetical protein